MLFKYKKRVLYALIGLVLILVVVLRHPLIQWGAECFLNANYPLDGGWKFRYEGMGYQKGRLLFKRVALATKHGHVMAEMESLGLFCRKWKGLHFDMGIVVESASVRLDQSEGRLAFSFSDSDFTIDIDHLAAELIDGKGSTSVYASLTSSDNIHTLYLSEKNGEISSITLKLLTWSRTPTIELTMQDANGSWVAKIFSFFHPSMGYGWEIAKGRVDGFLRLDGVEKTIANFKLSDLGAVHEKNGLDFVTNALTLDLSYPTLTLKSEIIGGRLGFKDPRTGIDFALCNLSGNLNFNSLKDSEVELEGYVDHKGQITPILLLGCPSLVDKDSLDIDLKLFMDPVKKSFTHLDLSMTMLDAYDFIIRGRLIDLDIDQIAMFQHMIGFFVPEIRDFQLHSGKVTCETSLRWQDGKMHKLRLDNMVADNLEIYWQSRDALGFAAHVEGSAELIFPSASELQFPTWEVKLQHGDLVLGREGGPISFSDINLHLFMCRDVFEPSWIKATYEGVLAHLDIVGYYAEADLTLGLHTNGERLLALFNKNAPLSDYEFNVELEFHRQLGYWDVGGDVKMYTKGVGKLPGEKGGAGTDECPPPGGWEDAARFNCFISDRILKNDTDLKTMLMESISKGTFQAETISCEFMKFIEVPWSIEGIISVEGNFDAHELEGRIKTSYLNFSSPFADVLINTETQGDFRYEKKENKWQGNFPLHRALIFEKYLKASFYDSDALVTFDGGEINLKQIKTEVEGLSLEGEAFFDFRDSFKMKVITNSVLGTVKQLEKFLSHIKEVTLPIDGKIVSGEEGVIFTLDESMDCEIHMSLVHGSYQFSHLNIQDLAFDFDGSWREQEALLSNITGKLGSYSLNGREVHLVLGSPTPTLFFDVRLENQTMDLMRLAASLDIKERRLNVEKDLSHFFGARLKQAEVTLLANGMPDLLRMDCTFQARDLVDAAKFARDFDFFPTLFDCLGNRTLDGVLSGKLTCKDNLWTLGITGNDILFGEQRFHEVALDVEKKDDWLRIKELRLDDYGFDAILDGSSIVEVLVASPFGEAEFRDGVIQEGKIHLPIETMRVGTVDVQGAIDISFETSLLDVVVRGLCELKSEDFGSEGIAFETTSPARVEYSQKLGLVVQDAKIEVRKDKARASLFVPTLVCNLQEKVYQGYRIQASLTSEAIEYLNKDVPKRDNVPTSMVFDFEWSPEKFQIGGLFEEGNYVWRGREYKVQQMSFQYDQRHLDIYLHTPLFGKEFGVNLKVLPYGAFETQIEAFEVKDPEKQLLLVDCRLKDVDGFTVQKMEGNLFGVEFHLLSLLGMQDEYGMTFMASAKINAEKLNTVLTGDMKSAISELKLGKGYELQGELTFSKEDWKKSSFEGFLKGRDFDLFGYQFRTLLSGLHIDDTGIKFSEIQVSDNAVSVKIPELTIQMQPENVLWFQMPELGITNLRPSLLHERGHPHHHRLKPFQIKHMVVQDVQGNLRDQKSFTGRGHLNFVNTFKKGHNLLDLPIEIISRLGLDMVLLIPIQGEMDYVIRNGKIVFTKLKNSFSESKRSYFYLWNKKESYLDFNGNIHIDIRMKQYVLFKITELFILSINGTLEQPRFSLK